MGRRYLLTQHPLLRLVSLAFCLVVSAFPIHRHILHTLSSGRRWAAHTHFLEGCNTSISYIAFTTLNTHSRATLPRLSKASTRLGSATSLEIHGLRLIRQSFIWTREPEIQAPCVAYESLNESNLYLRLVYKRSHSESI